MLEKVPVSTVESTVTGSVRCKYGRHKAIIKQVNKRNGTINYYYYLKVWCNQTR